MCDRPTRAGTRPEAGGHAGSQRNTGPKHPKIDLVVTATAGRGSIARFMMGSVTDKILRAAPCPVLTLHPHDQVAEGEGSRAA
jgi:nucleotide-binding universal stress UspA family protein